MVSLIVTFSRVMEPLLAQSAREDQQLVSPESLCSHRVRLVSYRERQVVTLRGRLKIKRGYYHCEESKSQSEGNKPVPASPGIAPFNQDWGLTRSQASPGVQRLLAKRSARLTHEEVAEAVEDLLHIRISARQVGEVIQPIGEAFLKQNQSILPSTFLPRNLRLLVVATVSKMAGSHW